LIEIYLFIILERASERGETEKRKKRKETTWNLVLNIIRL